MESERPIAVWGAVTANLVIAVAKFAAAAISGSSATLAEGFHSVVDTGNQLLLLIGLSRSRRKPDALHPFGYGNELYFWSLLVAMLLFGIGGGLSIYEGVRALLHPAPAGDPLWSYITLGVAMVAESASLTIAARTMAGGSKPASLWRRVQRSKDPTKFLVVGEDTAAVAGLLVALAGTALGQLTGSHLPDAISSILIGAILCATATVLVIETKDLMIGESARPEIVTELKAMVQTPWIASFARPPLTMHLGPHRVLVNLEVELEPDMTATQLTEHFSRAEAEIHAHHPEVQRLFIRPVVKPAPSS
jgi:cation diffusion facilitator family transporter